MRYSPSSTPFPFPANFTCGEAYVNWPEGKDLVLTGSFETEVAIPEAWVALGDHDDGQSNSTKGAYSLVMLTKRMMGCGKTKFVPVYSMRAWHPSHRIAERAVLTKRNREQTVPLRHPQQRATETLA